MKLVLILVAILLTPSTAIAYQTEVDPQMMQWKREGLARWVREHKKELREQRQTTGPTTSVPEATPIGGSYPSGVLSASQVASYARAAGFPESVVPTMVAIAYRESRFNPGAINASSGACGLWQLYPCPGAYALTPLGNAQGAFMKYSADTDPGPGYVPAGLSPWGY